MSHRYRSHSVTGVDAGGGERARGRATMLEADATPASAVRGGRGKIPGRET
jgi:hypothetical protein